MDAVKLCPCTIEALTQNDYEYNAAGMRTSNVVYVDGQGAARTEQYGYDELYRLTGVNYGDGMTQGYAFDNMGNRLTKTENGTPEAYTYNAANMLVSRSGQPYVNDPNGNTLSGGGRTNTWDSQNRLVQCVSGGNTSQFVYGSDGLRRTATVNGNPVHYVHDSSMMVRALRAEGQELRAKATYLIGPRGPEYRYDHQSQTIRWYCYDGLGSVLAEVDPLGNLTASRKYDVYGLVRWSNGSSTSKHKYVGSLGHTSDDETALIYMRARWMDPSLGRFISEDPARDGANWFEYCRGNPVNAVDPDGRTSEEAGFWFAISGLMSVVTSMLLGGVYRFGLGVLEWTKATSKFLESEAAFESGNSFGGAALKAEALDLMGRARASMLRGGLMVALGVALVVTVVYGMFVSLVDHPEWD